MRLAFLIALGFFVLNCSPPDPDPSWDMVADCRADSGPVDAGAADVVVTCPPEARDLGFCAALTDGDVASACAGIDECTQYECTRDSYHDPTNPCLAGQTAACAACRCLARTATLCHYLVERCSCH